MKSKRGLLACLLVLAATPAHAGYVVQWASGFESAVVGQNLTPSTFTGGVSTTRPTFVAPGAAILGGSAFASFTPAFGGIGNRAALSLNSSTAGADQYGTLLLGATQTQLAAGTYLATGLAPTWACVGGSRAGLVCLPGSTDVGSNCPSSYCRARRMPLVTLKDSSTQGCTLYVTQTCGAVKTSACQVPAEEYQVLYGSAQITGGRCGSSRSMTDTVCGGTCTSVSQCLPGRPLVGGYPGGLESSNPTRCVKDEDESTDCAGGNCHCINECDENRPNEATCAPKLFADIGRPQGGTYVAVLEQIKGTGSAATCNFYGGVVTSLCVGGSNAGGLCASNGDCPSSGVCTSGLSQVFQRGGPEQKVGVCTGGSTLDIGGRNGAACAVNADCDCRSDLPWYDGSCTAGTCTGTAATPIVTPDRVVFGWNDGNSWKAAVAMDHLYVATTADGGTPPLNWNGETSTVSGGTDGWTGTRTGCGTTNQGGCFRGGGTPANEPDGNTSSLESANESVDELVTFGNLTTSNTPFAAALEVIGQDRGGASSDGIVLSIEGYDGTTPTSGYNPSGKSCSPACPGYFFADNDTRGSSGDYELLPPKVVTSAPTGGGSLTTSAVNNLRAKFKKTGYAGATSGTTDKGRLTFAARTTFYATVAPLKPNLLPSTKKFGILGDSISNQETFKIGVIGGAVEPNAILDQASGGKTMGDLLAAAPTLFEGGSTASMDTVALTGTAGPIDVGVVFISANTLRQPGPPSLAIPSNPTAWDGENMPGRCEQWTSGGGYGAQQGKACTCSETSKWTNPASYGCLVKRDGVFGSTVGFCTCSANADCSLGGTAPPGTITTTTCAGKCAFGSGSANNGASCTTSATCTGGGTCLFQCATGSGHKISDAAGTISTWAVPGCASPDCGGGWCYASESVARLLAGKRQIEVLAAAASHHPKLIWVTQPPPTGTTQNGAWTGWYQIRPQMEAWNATLLAEQEAIGGNWIDLYQYFLDVVPAPYPQADLPNTCIKDNVHYTEDCQLKYASLVTACLSNTTLAGVPNKQTDGVCTSGPTCSGGTCSSGLRKGIACIGNDDCNYCSDGAGGKLGRECDADSDCGYYYCGALS